MAEATQSPERAGGQQRLLRFDRVERVVHWVNAALFFSLLATGASLYLEPIGRLVGRRNLVQMIHVYSGIALPVPVLIAIAGRWGKGLRADLRRINRWSDDDRAWMRAVGTGGERRVTARRHLTIGKFNPGQKLNAAFTGGTIAVMLATGIIMQWYHPWPLSFRTGATFVHDWLTLASFLAIVGHISYALRDKEAMGAMWGGRVRRRWAIRHAPGWLAEIDAVQRQLDEPAAPARP